MSSWSPICWVFCFQGSLDSHVSVLWNIRKNWSFPLCVCAAEWLCHPASFTAGGSCAVNCAPPLEIPLKGILKPIQRAAWGMPAENQKTTHCSSGCTSTSPRLSTLLRPCLHWDGLHGEMPTEDMGSYGAGPFWPLPEQASPSVHFTVWILLYHRVLCGESVATAFASGVLYSLPYAQGCISLCPTLLPPSKSPGEAPRWQMDQWLFPYLLLDLNLSMLEKSLTPPGFKRELFGWAQAAPTAKYSRVKQEGTGSGGTARLQGRLVGACKTETSPRRMFVIGMRTHKHFRGRGREGRDVW